MGLHTLGERSVRQEIVEAGVNQDLCGGLSRKSRAFSYLLRPGSRCLDMRAIAVTYIQAKPGIIRHNIWCQSSTLVDIMEPRGRFNMLAHQVNALGEKLCRMHSAPSKPGTSSGMRAFPKELDLHLVDRRRSKAGDLGGRNGIPMPS